MIFLIHLFFKLPKFPNSSPIFSTSYSGCERLIEVSYLLLNEAQPLLLQASFDKTSLWELVGLGGLEPPTSPLSGVRSNQAELQTRLKRKRILTFIYQR